MTRVLMYVQGTMKNTIQKKVLFATGNEKKWCAILSFYKFIDEIYMATVCLSPSHGSQPKRFIKFSLGSSLMVTLASSTRK